MPEGTQLGTGYIELKIEDKDLDRSKGRVDAKMNALTASMRRVGEAASSVARKIATISGVGGTLGLGGAMIAFTKFEKSMSRVGALSGSTGKVFDALSKQAQNLGRSTEFSASQAADAMGYLALAGFDAQKIMTAMPNVLKLAAAGQRDIAESADIVAKIMAGMGLTAGETAHAVDVLTKAFTTSTTDLSMLGEAFKYVGPIAKGLGIQIEEVAAAIQVMSNAGVQSTMAGTTLRNLYIRLSGGAKEATKALDKLGIETSDSQGKMRPLADIIDDVASATSNMTDAQRTFYYAQIAGFRAIAGFSEIVQQGGGVLRDFQKRLEGSAGTAGAIATRQMDNLAGAMKRVQSAAEGVAIMVGNVLEPYMRPFFEWLAGALIKLEFAIDHWRMAWAAAIDGMKLKLFELRDAASFVLTDGIPRALEWLAQNLPTLMDRIGDAFYQWVIKFGGGVGSDWLSKFFEGLKKGFSGTGASGMGAGVQLNTGGASMGGGGSGNIIGAPEDVKRIGNAGRALTIAATLQALRQGATGLAKRVAWPMIFLDLFGSMGPIKRGQPGAPDFPGWDKFLGMPQDGGSGGGGGMAAAVPTNVMAAVFDTWFKSYKKLTPFPDLLAGMPEGEDTMRQREKLANAMSGLKVSFDEWQKTNPAAVAAAGGLGATPGIPGGAGAGGVGVAGTFVDPIAMWNNMQQAAIASSPAMHAAKQTAQNTKSAAEFLRDIKRMVTAIHNNRMRGGPDLVVGVLGE